MQKQDLHGIMSAVCLELSIQYSPLNNVTVVLHHTAHCYNTETVYVYGSSLLPQSTCSQTLSVYVSSHINFIGSQNVDVVASFANFIENNALQHSYLATKRAPSCDSVSTSRCIFRTYLLDSSVRFIDSASFSRAP